MNHPINLPRTLTMLGAALVISMATAQDGKRHTTHDPASRSKARTEQMARELDLNADQATKIQAIKDHYHARFEKVRAIEDKDQRQQAMRELHSTRENEIRSVLTPAQDARWKELQAERKAKMEQRKAGGKERQLRKGHAPHKEHKPEQRVKDPQN